MRRKNYHNSRSHAEAIKIKIIPYSYTAASIPQIWNRNLAQLPHSFGLKFPPIFDSTFPLNFGLLSFLGKKVLSKVYIEK